MAVSKQVSMCVFLGYVRYRHADGTVTAVRCNILTNEQSDCSQVSNSFHRSKSGLIKFNELLFLNRTIKEELRDKGNN